MYIRTKFGVIPNIVALYSFSFLIALCIKSLEMLVNVHLGEGNESYAWVG